MHIGKYDDYFSYNVDACIKACPWWNPFCISGCHLQGGAKTTVDSTIGAGQKAIDDQIQRTANEFFNQFNTRITPVLAMAGIIIGGLVAAVLLVK